MTKRERLQKKKQQWEEKKEYLLAKQELKSDIKSIKNKNKTSTSKFLMAFLFINCSIIQIYTMAVIILSMKMGFQADFGPLQMLITAVVAQVIGYAIYSLKASKENSTGGIVYETTMKKIEMENTEEKDQEEAVG